MKILISNKISCENVPFDLLTELKGKLSFVNPKYLELQKHGYWTGKTSRMLKFYEISDNGALILPRGYMRQLISLCRKYNVNYELQDNRRTLPEIDITFKGRLRNYQEDAVTAILRRDFGVFSSPPGSGKTTMCLYTISKRKQPALIIVHTRELLLQWVSRIEQFLGIPKEQVGIIGGGQKTIGQKITVSLIQSLYKVANEIKSYVGFLIVDECHRCPSRTFTEAVSCFDSKFQLGLSATVYRRDQLTKLIFWFLGDLSHKVERADLVKKGHVLPFEVVTRETSFTTHFDPSQDYSKMLSELTQDRNRNQLIIKDVIKETSNGNGTCLILSDRKQHCEEFKVLLRSHGIQALLLTGSVSNKDRQDIVEKLDAGKVKVLIATTQLLSEGFDSKELTILFLASPIKFSGRLLQAVGRILRPGEKKEAKVYDYIDSKVPVLAASAKARERVYN